MAIKKKKNTVRLWQGLRMKHQKRNYYFYYYIWTSSSFLGEGEHFSVCPIHFFFLFFIWHTRNNRERKRAMTIACTLSVKKKLEECGDLFVCKKKRERVVAALVVLHFHYVTPAALFFYCFARTNSIIGFSVCRLGTFLYPLQVSWAIVLISLES